MVIRRQTICIEFLIRNVRYWKRDIMYIASAFKVLQSCDAGSIAGKFSSQIIRQAQCVHVTKLSRWFAQVRSV